jgi:Fe-S oxidoreductase
MCPSFRATRRENDTVRGRARQLQQALRSPEDLRPSLEALALCLNCKACKHECPNRVDMSRLKSETLAEAYAREGIPLRERLLSQPGDWLNRLPSWLTRNRSAAALAGRLLGLSPDRPLPKPAAERFTRLWQKHGSRWKRHGRPRAAIFIDTWTEFYQPSAGIALARILHGMGYTPDPRWLGDSQRVAISRGCLMEAKTRGEALFIALDQWDSETPILTLEPSCHSALTDDLPDLLADVKRAKRVAARIEPAEAFLARPLGANPTSLFRSDLPPLRLLIHPHCHARAAGQADAILALCKRVPGVEARETRAGCCGLAGWWGYAKENAALSRRIAEDRFLPAIRGLNDGERFAASGFSCRCQAEALAEVQPRHPLEWMAERLSGVPE